jgi:hypothetical protein
LWAPKHQIPTPGSIETSPTAPAPPLSAFGKKGWPASRWDRTFAMNVSQIYDAEESESVEMKIELEKKEAAN